MTTIFFLCIAGFIAGFIDSIVGGGGLIQLPALLVALPQSPVPVLLGTNKLASMAGTTVAMIRFQRAVKFELRQYLPAIAAAFIGSAIGAYLATQFSSHQIKPVIFVLLIAVCVFFLVRPEFGSSEMREIPLRTRVRRATCLAACIGMYDGFFGPGTGTWLIVGGVTILGLNFIRASAFAKIINLATNLAAFTTFAAANAVDWKVGMPLACCSIAGSAIGARFAISKGDTFVRKVFFCVVGALIVKLGMDIFL